jgi:Tol biopolymer transport system component
MLKPIFRFLVLMIALLNSLVFSAIALAQPTEVLTYIANEGTRWNANRVYLLDVERRIHLSITPILDAYSELEWSSDGKRLAFAADYTRYRRLYLWEGTVSAERKLFGYYSNLVWSEGGDQLLFYSRAEGYSMDATTGRVMKAENLPYQAKAMVTELYTPFGEYISPDGRWKMMRQPEDRSYDLIDTASGETVQNFITVRNLTWSPAGKWVVFTDNRETLYVVSLEFADRIWSLKALNTSRMEWRP